jgi:hypothetical protein
MADEGEIANPDQPLKTIAQYSKYLSEMKPEDHRAKLEDALKFIVH